ncbi:uncharacterized protein LOC112523059 [Cynara cardunculus var. scolymus]|uniref:Uncharacterized protein n=1 Tax=Cynara cardunculus var. scolymus TaxID=59895 RepID=A0A103YI64_CYNCS|nr:uncharacterized protein LOC112523059 [Cynara cardunculus var. scolymus]KVI09520.1 hypothetical protein Ccrd_012085 [Cynara cardunculus var. scolymus]
MNIGVMSVGSLTSSWRNQKPSKPCYCSSRDPPPRKPPSPQNGDDRNNNNEDKFSTTDWDKAWSSFKKQGKKSLFSQFTPNKYVSWNPRRSNYPLSEEVDPIKRAERSNLKLWTSPGFTLGGAIVIVTFLLIYTILYPLN